MVRRQPAPVSSAASAFSPANAAGSGISSGSTYSRKCRRLADERAGRPGPHPTPAGRRRGQQLGHATRVADGRRHVGAVRDRPDHAQQRRIGERDPRAPSPSPASSRAPRRRPARSARSGRGSPRSRSPDVDEVLQHVVADRLQVDLAPSRGPASSAAPPPSRVQLLRVRPVERRRVIQRSGSPSRAPRSRRSSVAACQNIFISLPAPSNRQSRISHRSGSLEPSSGNAPSLPLE